MSKTTKSTQDQTTHDVVTPNNPAWVDSILQGSTGNIAGLMGADPHSFIAGPNALQTQAGAGAAGLTGTPGTYAGANDLSTSIGQMNAPDIASLMNPFKGAYDNRVINPALAAFDQNAGMTRASNDLSMARNGAFGGSGAALTKSLTDQGLALSRGQLQGGLLSDQYKTALQGATSQAGVNQTQQGLRLNAAGQLVNSANSQGDNTRANIGAQGTIGSILQGLDQAQTGAPITTAGSLASILGSLPLGLVHGQTSDGTMHGTSTQSVSDPMSTIGSLAMLAAAPFTGGASLAGGLGGLGAMMGGSGGGMGALGSLFGSGGGSSLRGLY